MLGLVSYRLQDSRPECRCNGKCFVAFDYSYLLQRDGIRLNLYPLSFLSEALCSVFAIIWSSPTSPAIFSLIESITNTDSKVFHCSAQPARPIPTSFDLPELPRYVIRPTTNSEPSLPDRRCSSSRLWEQVWANGSVGRDIDGFSTGNETAHLEHSRHQ